MKPYSRTIDVGCGITFQVNSEEVDGQPLVRVSVQAEPPPDIKCSTYYPFYLLVPLGTAMQISDSLAAAVQASGRMFGRGAMVQLDAAEEPEK